MYVIREVMHCKPGQVREMVDKFKVISEALERMGHAPMRIMTDVSGPPYWTVVAEIEVATLDAFQELEDATMADEKVQSAMAGYHELVAHGRREIFTLES